MYTVKESVRDEVNATGPCTLQHLIWYAKQQATNCANTDYQVKDQVVQAINVLCRENEIELYDTGDAWVNTIK